jgi:hypothetical protein
LKLGAADAALEKLEAGKAIRVFEQHAATGAFVDDLTVGVFLPMKCLIDARAADRTTEWACCSVSH